MFRAIGLLIVLWGFSQFFTASFEKADEAGVAVLQAIISASEQFETQLESATTTYYRN